MEFALGKHRILRRKTLAQRLVSKNTLYGALGIVEIALDSSDGNVVAGLGDHLQSLDFACAVMRVEHGNAQPERIRETSQSSLAGIAARCGKNHDFFARALRARLMS